MMVPKFFRAKVTRAEHRLPLLKYVLNEPVEIVEKIVRVSFQKIVHYFVVIFMRWIYDTHIRNCHMRHMICQWKTFILFQLNEVITAFKTDIG